jgi:hypothetical protein
VRSLAVAAFDALFALGEEVTFASATGASLYVWACVFIVSVSVAVQALFQMNKALWF